MVIYSWSREGVPYGLALMQDATISVVRWVPWMTKGATSKQRIYGTCAVSEGDSCVLREGIK